MSGDGRSHFSARGLSSGNPIKAKGPTVTSPSPAEYRQAHQVTHPKYPQALIDQWATYNQAQVRKKGEFHVSIPPYLPSIKSGPTQCLLADSLPSAVLPATPLGCIQLCPG